MLESAQPTADELKGVISDALAAGVLTKDDILDMVSTAESPTSASGHTPAGPTIGTDDLPIYTELPEGLIDLPTAARNYGCQLQRFYMWVRRGQLKAHGRLRASSPGGGYIVVSQTELATRMNTVREKGGRPRKKR